LQRKGGRQQGGDLRRVVKGGQEGRREGGGEGRVWSRRWRRRGGGRGIVVGEIGGWKLGSRELA